MIRAICSDQLRLEVINIPRSLCEVQAEIGELLTKYSGCFPEYNAAL